MKNRTIALLLATVCMAIKADAYSVSMPPGNIVQNGNFTALWTDWSGNSPAILNNWPSIPGDNAALVTDIYQNLSTTPGQKYELSFFAAADLFFGPSVNILVALNNQSLTSFDTQPFAYNPQLNRYEQMHWQEYIFQFTASSSTTKLEFVDNNTHDFAMSEVSVVRAVPDGGNTAWMLMVALAVPCCCYRRWKAQPSARVQRVRVGL
jgi:hypothetical protein